jgi:DNA polymerase I-like protein with 3'-5' exonuclease and polymerase domains
MKCLNCEDRDRARIVAYLKARILEARIPLAGRTVLPTIHPAFVLRLETWHPIFQIDVKRCGRVLRGEVTTTADEGEHVILSKPREVEAALTHLGPEVGFDIESDGKHPLTANITCLGFSDGNRTIVIYPWKENYPRLLPILTRFFNSNRKFVGHNILAYDIPCIEKDGIPNDTRRLAFLERVGIEFNYSKLEDTLLAHHAFASHLPQRLDQLVSENLDSAPWKMVHGMRGGDEKGLLPHQMPPEELTRYNAADCRLTIKVWRRLQGNLEKERAIYELDKTRLTPMCSHMQKAGIRVDESRRQELSLKLESKAQQLLLDMRRHTRNRNFHPLKLDDLRQTIFKQFGAPVMRYTPTGLVATGAAVLQGLRGLDTNAGKLAGMVLDYRSAVKINSVYLKGISVFRDGRIHPGWKAFGTVAGRLSSPQQQLPRRSHPKENILEERVREIYIPRKGCVFVYFDISQAEMRCAANLSGDPVFMKAAAEKDVHTANAKIIFGSYPEAVEALKDPKGAGKFYRDVSKNVGFAVNYLASDETLFLWMQGQELPRPITMPEVRRMLSILHVTFRVHFRYIDQNVELVKKQGFLRSPIAGRLRWFGWNPKPTEIANFPVQSCVADVMNERLPEICCRSIVGFAERCGLPNSRKTRGIPHVRLVAQIHDAGYFECPKNDVKQLQDIIAEAWEPDVVLPESGRRFKLPVDSKTAERWSELG